MSNKQSPTQRKVQINGLYIILALWGVVIIHGAWNRATQVAQIPYSQFQAYLSENRVDKVKIDSQTIRGELVEPEEGQPERFVTVRVEPELAEELSGHGVEFAGEVEGGFFAVLMSCRILYQQYEKALMVLREHSSVLKKAAAALLERETITGRELEALMTTAVVEADERTFETTSV